MLALRTRAAAPAARAPAHRVRVPRVVRSTPAQQAAAVDQLTSKVQKAIDTAEETCKEAPGAECAVAWDEVEELSAQADRKRKVAATSDPLEKFCESDPSADECRVYED